jgi:beta-lactam-binding protein with PASTA domain
MRYLLELFKPESFRDVILHLVIVVGLSAALLLGFFYVYLPNSTHHGESITVPNVVGMSITELDNFLSESGLEYVINDSSYNSSVPPLTVILQYPTAGFHVKEGRKIYVSINAKNPPQVKMPNLINRSITSAQEELDSYGLKLGEVTYIPNLMKDAVLKQLFNGQEIKVGDKVAKGSKIDLVVGDGLGDQEFDVPDLNGKLLDEADFILSASRLQLGSVVTDETKTDLPPGTIFKQKPESGRKIRVGDVVDVWVAGGSEETTTPSTKY